MRDERLGPELPEAIKNALEIKGSVNLNGLPFRLAVLMGSVMGENYECVLSFDAEGNLVRNVIYPADFASQGGTLTDEEDTGT